VYRYNLTYRKPRTDLGDRLYGKGVTGTVYLSEFIEGDARAESVRYSGRSYRIPNGFDTEVFAPDEGAAAAFRARFGFGADEAIVMSAGKLVAGKRFDRGIDALARVRLQGGRRLTYVLCGDGPEEVTLREMGDRAGVRVLVTGMIDQNALRGAYNAADLFLHTGRETFGNVVGEAMACGRAVVCVREGAAPEVVGEGGKTGVLVSLVNSDALASAITTLLNDSELCRTIGSEARRRIQQVFPVERMVSGYEDMFTALVAGRK
jgi:glycosyltransferase involved in cell wall biosynthesis